MALADGGDATVQLPHRTKINQSSNEEFISATILDGGSKRPGRKKPRTWRRQAAPQGKQGWQKGELSAAQQGVLDREGNENQQQWQTELGNI